YRLPFLFSLGKPPHCICQKNSKIRLPCNCKQVNDSTVVPQLPFTLIDDVLEKLGGATTYSVLNLQSDFWQCTIKEDSIPITVVTTREGLFEWTRVFQGTCGSPGWFSRVLQIVI
ncbi:unnamed protein product, partial [Discosporangium mesarthrocarpum]